MTGRGGLPPGASEGRQSDPGGARKFGVEHLGALDDRELDGDALLEVANDLSPHRAERHLHAERRPGEIVLVAGSLFLVAAAREELRRRQERIPA